MTSGIYAITHQPSGKIYIGSSVNIERRWGDHRKRLRAGTHHSRHLQSAWNKYGEPAFTFDLLLECDVSKLHSIEQVAITEFAPEFNMTDCVDAPMRGRKHSAETKAKLVAARARQIFTPETREKLAAARKTWVLTSESRAKISAARMGMKFTPEHCANMAAARVGKPGHAVSMELRVQISEKLMGHAVSQSTREAVRAAHLGTKASDETRRKMSEAHKRRHAEKKQAALTITQEAS